MAYYIGTDIGGTFTDCVVMDDQGAMTISKSPSTPPHFANGLINALKDATVQGDFSLETLLSEAKLLSHGCTVATNTLINRSGAKVGMLTTRGFEEVLFMMRGSAHCQGLPVEDWYHKTQNPRPFDIVPLDLIVGINERVDKDGVILVKINRKEIQSAAQYLIKDKGCDAIAISFLWSFVNPVHEQEAKKLLENTFPNIPVDTSHEILPLLGEYERFSTTALSSYLRPEVENYVSDLKGRLEVLGLGTPFYLMQANGGLLDGIKAARSAVKILQSGPTGGVIAGKIIGDLMGSQNIITSDMGGTSFDMSLITKGEINYTIKSYHSRHAVATPMIDIQSIGAGGGSIAYLEDGIMKVGPQSAGAAPGPICYERGGENPTVTDANLVLGYLNPYYFLGGKMTLNKDKAYQAIDEQLATPLGLSPLETSDGIYRIVNSHMSDAIRFHVLKRGYDPRDFDLFLFGGATPAHAVGIAETLGVKSVVVPFSGMATVLSAFGILNSDILRFYLASQAFSFTPENIKELNVIYNNLEKQGFKDLIDDGFQEEDIHFQRLASMRYHLQLTDIDIDIPKGELTEKDVTDISDRFDNRYAELYGKNAGFKEAGRDIISQFVRMIAKVPKGLIEPAPLSPPDPSHAHKGGRKAYFTEERNFIDTEIYDGDSLEPGNKVPGPSILEMMGTTVVVPPHYRASLDEYRNIRIQKIDK